MGQGTDFHVGEREFYYGAATGCFQQTTTTYGGMDCPVEWMSVSLPLAIE